MGYYSCSKTGNKNRQALKESEPNVRVTCLRRNGGKMRERLRVFTVTVKGTRLHRKIKWVDHVWGFLHQPAAAAEGQLIISGSSSLSTGNLMLNSTIETLFSAQAKYKSDDLKDTGIVLGQFLPARCALNMQLNSFFSSRWPLVGLPLSKQSLWGDCLEVFISAEMAEQVFGLCHTQNASTELTKGSWDCTPFR